MAFATAAATRSLSTAALLHSAIKNVTVIGGGLMGSGIAQVAAQTGHQVTLVDVSDDILKKAEDSIKKSLGRIAKKQFANDEEGGKKFVADTLYRLNIKTNQDDAVKNADLVIEAIVENLEVKQKLFSSLDKIAPQTAIFASNTSSLPISEIASSTKRKDRFGGLHFFNPVPVMKLLEVIRLPETSEDTYKKMMEFGKQMGKQTITCKDTPGFVVNRLLIPYMNEAFRMLERGDATAKDIDMAMKLGAGYPMGPFELADYVGLDVNKFIQDGWHKRFPDDPLFKPIALLDKMVAEGKFGIKSGEGFYKYDKK